MGATTDREASTSRDEPPQIVLTLECIECGRHDERGRGWRAYLSDDDDLCVYCPECAALEFNDS